MKFLRYSLLITIVLLCGACGNSHTNGDEKHPHSSPLSDQALSEKIATIPSYNLSPKPADSRGVESTADQLAQKIKLGFNIGNTLEAYGCKPASESCWGNPPITTEMIRAIKRAGFSAVRLPISWDQYADPATAKINPEWMQRIKGLVKDCVDNDLYVMVNIHWDGGWLENNIDVPPNNQTYIKAKQKAYWEQIATSLEEFDEHLLFASANEPNLDTDDNKDNQQQPTEAQRKQMDTLLAYHQTFVDAVRSTGGKNSYRTLIVQGPATDIELTHRVMNALPNDTASNRLMIEVHFYTPFNFTLMAKDESWGKQSYYWGKNYHSKTDTKHNSTWGEEEFVNKVFGLMKTQFVDKGIPVIIGEFGARQRNNLTGEDLKLHIESRNHYINYVVKEATSMGMIPVLWDIGGMIDRRSYEVLDQPGLNALLSGAK